MRLGVQLFTLRQIDEPLTTTIRRLGDSPFDGVQFAGLSDCTPGQIRDALDEAGLDAAGAHVPIESLEEENDEILDAYGTIGCDQFTIPTYDRSAFETSERAREAGKRLSILADRLAADGIDLHYHNHTFEFTQADNETVFDVFVDAATGVGLEIDTGLANHVEVDPVELLSKYGDRVKIVHMTDSIPGTTTRHRDLGTGTVDVQACVETARKIGSEWIVFEHGGTDHPWSSIRDAAELLRPQIQ